MIKSLFVVALFLFISGAAQAQIIPSGVEQFITLKNGHKLFTRYTAPQKDQPTLVFVNGLTYSTNDYTALASDLIDKGYGVLLYDAFGMGRTLLENPIPTAPIDYVDQINELDELLKILQIKAPYNMVGLSYGGGILIGYGTRFPKKVNKLFLLSPYTEVIEKGKNIILDQIKWTKIFFPFNDATDEELANFYLRMFAYLNYPISEPTVLENPFKLEGVIRLTQGITPYSPISEAPKLPKKAVHMMTGIYDQYVERDVYDRFWEAAKAAQPCSSVRINFSEHKLPQSFPNYVARWIHANFKADYCTGQVYYANPFTGYMSPDEGDDFYLPDFKE